MNIIMFIKVNFIETEGHSHTEDLIKLKLVLTSVPHIYFQDSSKPSSCKIKNIIYKHEVHMKVQSVFVFCQFTVGLYVSLLLGYYQFIYQIIVSLLSVYILVYVSLFLGYYQFICQFIVSLLLVYYQFICQFTTTPLYCCTVKLLKVYVSSLIVYFQFTCQFSLLTNSIYRFFYIDKNFPFFS